ncbi:MAG: hypothetical protein U0807_10550 [Candidatus Binatia bacterium]
MRLTANLKVLSPSLAVGSVTCKRGTLRACTGASRFFGEAFNVDCLQRRAVSFRDLGHA